MQAERTGLRHLFSPAVTRLVGRLLLPGGDFDRRALVRVNAVPAVRDQRDDMSVD